MPQLDFSTYPSQLFWLVISFAALYFVLAVVVLPRLTKVQQMRTDETSGKRDAALAATQKAEATLASYQDFIAEERAKALREAQTLRSATDKRLAEENEKTKTRLDAEMEAAASDIQTFLAQAQKEVALAAEQTAQEIVHSLTSKN